MELSNLKPSKVAISQVKINQLKRAGIEDTVDLLHYLPRKYIDRGTFTALCPGQGESVILFLCKSVNCYNGSKDVIEAVGVLWGTEEAFPVHILWFNQRYLQTTITNTIGQCVTVASVFTYEEADPRYNKPARYQTTNPAVYSDKGADALKIYPVYKKIPGMAESTLAHIIQSAFDLHPNEPETIPFAMLKDHNLMDHNTMLRQLHAPTNAEELDRALTRKRFDDLLYFALRLEMEQRRVPRGSIYNIQSLSTMNAIRKTLPYELTDDQAAALNEAIRHIQSGKRLNALLQGDVGCGKSIVAFLLMLAFASNGHQTAIMAPTAILAQQHYQDLRPLCEEMNIPLVFVEGGGDKTKAQKQLKKDIAEGNYKIIVGTQALLGEGYQFKSLALVVEDEEHKYGVAQRKTLAEKAVGGTHVLTMSATPIPRSLAQTIYGENLQLLTITQKPTGRKAVQTGIACNAKKAISFLRRSCGEQGRQAYVVCPMIAESDKVEGIMTAETAFEYYRDALREQNISVALVTGNTPKPVAAQMLQDFAAGNISILVSTTVIEVGVNVPNANCIIIHNAERFGLAQLHQLRGRVGRGEHEAFCCLISDDPANSRLQAMVETNDGFAIAQRDLEQRGAGDFLGVQQSGTEKLLSLALRHPSEYHQAQNTARDILDLYSNECLLLKQAQKDMDEQKGGEVLS